MEGITNIFAGVSSLMRATEVNADGEWDIRKTPIALTGTELVLHEGIESECPYQTPRLTWTIRHLWSNRQLTYFVNISLIGNILRKWNVDVCSWIWLNILAMIWGEHTDLMTRRVNEFSWEHRHKQTRKTQEIVFIILKLTYMIKKFSRMSRNKI